VVQLVDHGRFFPTGDFGPLHTTGEFWSEPIVPPANAALIDGAMAEQTAKFKAVESILDTLPFGQVEDE
jgi:hypothetical protein